MRNKVAPRFWIEGALALATGLAFMLILVRRDWIEAVLPVDFDQHTGTLEILVAGVLGVLTICFSVLARNEWLLPRPAADRE